MFGDPMPTPPPSTEEPTFEQAMERLDEIVSVMEGDRMPLDEMVACYEEGMRLLKACRQRIDSAKRRVELISAEAEGKTTLTAFEPGAEAAEEPPKAAATRRRAKPEAEDSEDIRLF